MIAAISRIIRERQSLLAVLVTLLLALFLVYGTNFALQSARAYDLRKSVADSAMALVEQLIANTPDHQTIFETGQVSDNQLAAIQRSAAHGHVYGIGLFAADGTTIKTYDAAAGHVEQHEVEDELLEVIRNRTAKTLVLNQAHRGHQGEFDAATYYPVFNAGGRVIGVVLMIVHHGDLDMPLNNFAGLALLAVPIICSFAFLIPALIMIRISRVAKLREAALSASILHDSLTGLMNRSAISGKARGLFADRRDPTEQIGILMIDLDNFKAVNDLNSHAVADLYLSQTGRRLLDVVGDAGFVARTNGDEFMIILPTITKEALERTTEQVRNAISAPALINGQTVICTAAIGYHLSPVGQSMDRALHAADLALKSATANGHGQTVEYVESLDRVATRHNQIETYLRHVGFERALEIHYQPFVDVGTGSVVGFEALARLRGEDGTMIRPDEFIPVAEGCGLIHDLGMVALRKAMRAAKRWPSALYVSVNLSPVQLQDPDLAEKIIDEMRKAGLPPERLELELTESMLLGDEDGVSRILKRLQTAGIRIAMDDFGTGYSSLGYLWKYNFDKIKIDRSFLLGHDFEQTRYFDIIETIILLGHKLGMSVTIEGVETHKQVEVLTEMACDQFQGFYFARPLTEAQATAVVQSLTSPLTRSAS